MYRNIILPVVLYGCETWTLTLRKERRMRVFESKALKRIFRPKKDEVTGDWRKLHKEELHVLYSSTNILWVIKLRRMRWAGCVVARIGRREACIEFWWVNPRDKDHSGDPGVDGTIILGWIFRKLVWGYGLDWAGSG
jgi:hypothetical protein